MFARLPKHFNVSSFYVVGDSDVWCFLLINSSFIQKKNSVYTVFWYMEVNTVKVLLILGYCVPFARRKFWWLYFFKPCPLSLYYWSFFCPLIWVLNILDLLFIILKFWYCFFPLLHEKSTFSFMEQRIFFHQHNFCFFLGLYLEAYLLLTLFLCL